MEKYSEDKNFRHNYESGYHIPSKEEIDKLMIPNSYIIKMLSKKQHCSEYLYMYDNYGNTLKSRRNYYDSMTYENLEFIKNSLRKTPMSNEEIDMFKTLIKDTDSIDIVNTLIDLNFNKIKEIDNLTKSIEKQNEIINHQNSMIKDLYQIVSNQQIVVENLNKIFG
jgi:hypothetical protein